MSPHIKPIILENEIIQPINFKIDLTKMRGSLLSFWFKIYIDIKLTDLGILLYPILLSAINF